MPAPATLPEHDPQRGANALVSGAIALGVVVVLGLSLGTPGVQGAERAVQRLVLGHQSPAAHGFFLGATIAGGITAMRVLALASALLLVRRIGRRAALSLVATPFVAEVLCDSAKRLYARPRPAGLGQGVDPTFSYPSAHAMVSAATCIAIAWFCWREGLVPGRIATSFAVLVPLLVGASRVYLNVHWTADVIGGWSGGIAVAAAVVAFDAGFRDPAPASGSSSSTSTTTA